MWTGGVRVIVPSLAGEVLMVKQRHEGIDLWMLPGGGVDEGETTIAAAKREVLEETGLEIEIARMVWYVEEAGDRGQRFVNFYLAHPVDSKPSLGYDPEFDENNQILQEVKFVKVNDLKKLKSLYPDFLKNELDVILQNSEERNPYKERLKPIRDL